MSDWSDPAPLRARIRALEAENARFREALELLRLDVNEIDRMRTRAEKAEALVAEWGSHHFDVHTECGFDVHFQREGGRESGVGPAVKPLDQGQNGAGTPAGTPAAAKPPSLDYLTSAARGEKRKAHIVSARRSAENQECGT